MVSEAFLISAAMAFLGLSPYLRLGIRIRARPPDLVDLRILFWIPLLYGFAAALLALALWGSTAFGIALAGIVLVADVVSIGLLLPSRRSRFWVTGVTASDRNLIRDLVQECLGYPSRLEEDQRPEESRNSRCIVGAVEFKTGIGGISFEPPLAAAQLELVSAELGLKLKGNGNRATTAVANQWVRLAVAGIALCVFTAFWLFET